MKHPSAAQLYVMLGARRLEACLCCRLLEGRFLPLKRLPAGCVPALETSPTKRGSAVESIPGQTANGENTAQSRKARIRVKVRSRWKRWS